MKELDIETPKYDEVISLAKNGYLSEAFNLYVHNYFDYNNRKDDEFVNLVNDYNIIVKKRRNNEIKKEDFNSRYKEYAIKLIEIIYNEISSLIQIYPKNAISINVLYKERSKVKFSISNTGNVAVLFDKVCINVLRWFDCDYADVHKLSSVISNTYEIIIDREIRQYNLYPQRLKNKDISWLLKPGDIELFVVKMDILETHSFDFNISIEAFNVECSNNNTLSSEDFEINGLLCIERKSEINISEIKIKWPKTIISAFTTPDIFDILRNDVKYLNFLSKEIENFLDCDIDEVAFDELQKLNDLPERNRVKMIMFLKNVKYLVSL